MRAALRFLIEQETDLAVVGEAATGADAARLTRLELPDIVILDTPLPDAAKIDALALIRAAAPAARLIVLSLEDDPLYARAAFAASASGYVLKRRADAQIVDAIRQVAAGEPFGYPAPA